ncbi:hypothetical protein RJ639_021901 [Escallonia herrerae]|uniref:RNase H type-1 domain-containing protein n=1 Tax=Escallonia herrerae TaxID=1293975 RepID=A0AA88V5X8_9ASTE|nr:hypothetical protein RJ639_021901 [Escallonia herrerae]
MAVAPPSTHHSHLDPGDLRLRLTSRSSYCRKYRSAADLTFDPKEKGEEHITRNGSCYSRDPSVPTPLPHRPPKLRPFEDLSTERGRLSFVPENGSLGRSHSKALSKQSLPKEELATLEIDNLDESVKYTAFLQGLRPTSKFTFSVNKSPPGNMKALLEKANKYIQAKEYLETNRDRRGEGKPEQKKRSREVTPPEGKSAKCSKRDERHPKDTFNLTPLNAKPSQILHEIKDNKALQWPDRMKSQPNKRNKDLWCHFHNDHGHTTDNYIKTFHDDPLVITIKAGNFDVKRVLIDNGSSAEILFHDAFKKMNIPTDRLQKMDTPLYGFSYHPVAAKGIIALPVAVGTPPAQANFMLDFVVVKVPSAYNAILGRLALNQLQAVVSTYHLKMKFPMEHGIGEVKGDQTTALTEVAVSTVLIREEVGVQKPIYYINKVLQDVETRYPKIDKIALALIISARRLRPYFQSHTIIILTDQLLRKVLLNPEASGRLVNWSVELGEFDIKYKPRTTIKAQALADFIVECTLPEEPPQLVISAALDPWNLYVDGSSALGSSGAGLILISPEGFTIEYALCFGFRASNNKAEYEALLAGIRLAHAFKVDSLSIHSDSQLVVNHVLGDYEARDERMAQYLNLVKTSAVKFQNFTIRRIPRDQNTQADTLSRLASAEETDARRPIYLEFLKERNISSQTEVETIEQEPCWMDMIVTYLSTRELPSERHEARNLRVKAARYALVEGTLYNKSFSLPYLRCLHPSESIYAL